MFALIFKLLKIMTVIVAQNSDGGCAVFDANRQLHVFSKAGDSSVAMDLQSIAPLTGINSSNRPPFTGVNMICLPSYNLNRVFFLNADPSNPTTLHSFQFATRVWRNIYMTGNGPDLTQVSAAIDYDTLVIYAFSPSMGMMRLGDASQVNLIKDTDNTKPFSLPWINGNTNPVPFSTTGFRPVLAHAWFNMYLFGVPGTLPGHVQPYRIHYNEWGSTPRYTGSDYDASSPGKAVTLQFKYDNQTEHGGSPAHVVFLPDNRSGMYVINSYVNTTIKLAPPPPSDGGDYAASDRYIVQYTPITGQLFYFDFESMKNGQSRSPDVESSVWKKAVSLPPMTDNPKPTTNSISSDFKVTPFIVDGFFLLTLTLIDNELRS